MDDLSYYLGRLFCSLGSHSCEDTEAFLRVGHIAFWVLIGAICVGALLVKKRQAEQQQQAPEAKPVVDNPVWEICERVGEAMFDVGYFPPNTPPAQARRIAAHSAKLPELLQR